MVIQQQQRESSSGSINRHQLDNGKYVRYTAEQVEALERVYAECPKPSSLRRQQLIRECPILSNIEPKQIKVWFQNRRSNFPSMFSVRCWTLFFFFLVAIVISFLSRFGVISVFLFSRVNVWGYKDLVFSCNWD